MTITLTPEIEAIVDEAIKSGSYDSPSEVVRDGLRLVKEQLQLKQIRREELRKEVMLGVEQMQRGNCTAYDSPEELGEAIKTRGLARLKEKQSAEKSNDNRLTIVKITELADADLDGIWTDFAENDLNAANKFIDGLATKFRWLAENAFAGGKTPEFVAILRSFPHKKYVIFYFPTEGGIEIFRILYALGNIDVVFDEFFERSDEQF